jgi:hypothetical protein
MQLPAAFEDFMTDQNRVIDHLRKYALLALDELFNEVHGMMLDPQEPMFRTLEEITAIDASRPIGIGASCLAAQVEHTAFYIDVLLNDTEGADWAVAWSLTSVTESEWTALKNRLRTSYEEMRTRIETESDWSEDFIATLVSLIGHNGFHLGQVREGTANLRRA